MRPTDRTQCTAVTPADARNPEGRLVLAGSQCDRDRGHEGSHWTRQLYHVGDPKNPERATLAPYEWDDPK